MEIESPDALQPMPAAAPAQAAKPPCRFRDMRLRVGDRIQLEPPPQTGLGRVSTKVIGWVEDQSLIMTMPYTPKGRIELLQGENVVLRAFTGRSAFAFRCTVLKNTTQSQYLHLSFPQSVDGVDVRSSPRYRAGLPGKVTAGNGEAAMEVRIDNISSTGALLIADSSLGASGDSIKLEFETVLHEIPVVLALEAEIRSAEAVPDKSQHRHGVAFVDPKVNDRLILAALVWFNMYENPKLSA